MVTALGPPYSRAITPGGLAGPKLRGLGESLLRRRGRWSEIDRDVALLAVDGRDARLLAVVVGGAPVVVEHHLRCSLAIRCIGDDHLDGLLVWVSEVVAVGRDDEAVAVNLL